tara:strand:+ start:325 stop:768 length:444 start_codon:yes stop_codon:yes gene_type:complete
MVKVAETKVCLVCGVDYVPVNNQYTRQKYCSKSCKEKKAWERNKERGIHKGGYSRHVPLVLWLDALGVEKHEVPCTYCKTMLTPYNFIIDHKKPRSEVASEHGVNAKYQIKNDISNMQLLCKDCNNLKGSTPHTIFQARVEDNNESV